MKYISRFVLASIIAISFIAFIACSASPGSSTSSSTASSASSSISSSSISNIQIFVTNSQWNAIISNGFSYIFLSLAGYTLGGTKVCVLTFGDGSEWIDSLPLDSNFNFSSNNICIQFWPFITNNLVETAPVTAYQFTNLPDPSPAGNPGSGAEAVTDLTSETLQFLN
jgi:hypothetical protein